MYIYIYIHARQHEPNDESGYSQSLPFAKFMVLPKRSTNVSLTKFESRSWIKQTPRSFPFSRSRTTNLAVLAENLSVTPPTPHDWSLRPMVLCLNRTGKRSEIYNLHIVGLQREDSPRKLPHPKKQRFNLPTPFTLWLSLGPPYRVFFFRNSYDTWTTWTLPQVGHRKDTATVATNDPMSLRGASRIDSSTKGTLDMNLPGGGSDGFFVDVDGWISNQPNP